MKTYTTLYTGETRALSIHVRDQNDDDFLPTSASTYIKNSDNEIIVTTTQCLISGADIISMVDTMVTSAAGDYEVVWEILKNGYVYKHKSGIKVEKI
jgi:hypothetical protein